MSKNNFALVDLDKIDAELYSEFYPRISHKQRKRVIDCIRRNEMIFEDVTGGDVTDLSPADFEKLSEAEKYLAYENMMIMFYGSQGELEELQESIIEEREEIGKR